MSFHVYLFDVNYVFHKTQGSLVATLKEVRPTAFLGVPRVWEKIHETMKGLSAQVTGMKKKVAVWAKDIGLRGNINLMNKYVYIKPEDIF